ncbi:MULTISPECIES: porin [Pandoraea]|uniref:porin n=1 Tax=Pandoraea TaxID=93217 RepID=UPI001F5C9CBC|nr:MULTISPECIES: porin [Pandoraea]MCI3206507.1 porin [Pandoraea sp. LA3]MDN4584535.1 porin [Pandoraea capi]
MKRAKWALGLLTLSTGLSYGQSNVTLYGIIDTGINYVSNSGGKSQWSMVDGTLSGIYGSRWGLTGSDDLGGGRSVAFKLENGFNSANGQLFQGGRQFGRQAYIELRDRSLGSLAIGRQYDEIVDFVQPVTFNGNWGPMFAHASDIDNTSDSYRVNNAIKFTSVDYGGLSFGAMLGLSNSNSPGTATVGNWSAGTRYRIGSLLIAAGYLQAKHPATLFPDGNFQANTSGAAIGAAGPFSYVGNPASLQEWGLGATWNIDAVTLGANYTRTLFGQANGTTATVAFTNYEVWANYHFAPSWTVGAEYTYTAGSVGYSGTSPGYQLVGVVIDKKLSKRTELYAMSSFQRANADAAHADIFEGAIASASSSRNQAALRIGMVHKF